MGWKLGIHRGSVRRASETDQEIQDDLGLYSAVDQCPVVGTEGVLNTHTQPDRSLENRAHDFPRGPTKPTIDMPPRHGNLAASSGRADPTARAGGRPAGWGGRQLASPKRTAAVSLRACPSRAMRVSLSPSAYRTRNGAVTVVHSIGA